MTATRSILHITAGSDTWQPTIEVMNTLVEMFQAAILSPDGAVVVTRTGVTAKVLDVQKGTTVELVYAHVDAMPTTEDTN